MDLTDQQKDILDYKGNLFIIASAGSGKTHTTILKINKIKSEEPNARILYITFTRKAKADAIKKIGKVKDIVVTNYHGLAYRILSEHKDILQVPDIDIVPESYGIEILSNIYEDKSTKELQELLRHIIGLKLKDIQVKDMNPDSKGLFIPFNTALKKQKKFMFSDLIYEVNKMFENLQIKPHVREQFLKFDYIMVDEIQDTCPYQYNMIKHLMNLNSNAKIMGTGDCFQSLYRWRMADPSLVLTFITQYSAQVLPLTVNFRSQKTIIDFANKVLDDTEEFPELRKPMNYFKLRGDDIIYRDFASDENQYQYVCTMIIKLINSGIKPSEIFVLFRMNLSGSKFERTAIRYHIPFKLLRGSLLERKEVKYLLALIKFANEAIIENAPDEYINFYLKDFAEELAPDIGKKSYSILYKLKNGMSLLQKLESVQLLNMSGVGATRTTAFVKFNKDINRIIDIYKKYEAEEIDMNSLFTQYREIIYEFKSIKKSSTMEFSAREETLNDVVNILFEMEGTLQERLSSLIIDYTSDEKDNKKEVVLGMTAHKAKGGEAKACFVIDTQMFPSPWSKDKEEEKRCFYVSVTRAEDKLYLTSSSDKVYYRKIMKNFEYLDSNVPQERMNYIEDSKCADPCGV